MKIAVFSDSHNMLQGMTYAVDKENPDVIFHLGDLQQDAEKLHELYPKIPLYSVYGNCDSNYSGNDKIIVELEGKKFFAAHGHTYSVKLNLDSIINAAMASGSDVLLFGHTHRAMEKELNGLIIINPGATSPVGTYEIITIQNGNITYENREVEIM